MDDGSVVIKLIEIVPVDNNRNYSESADVKVSQCHVKVCTQYILYLQICCVAFKLQMISIWLS